MIDLTPAQIKQALRLYLVTDDALCLHHSLLDVVQLAVQSGVTCVQLREKELDDAAFLQEALELKALCQSYKVPFIVNDNVAVAAACHADGIHVGQHDMQAQNARARVGEGMLLGVSVQTVAQAAEAKKNGADYLGVGAVFPTSTKADADAVPYETLKAICEAVEIPVVAIGGINKENLLQLSGSGVDGVALVSAIFGSKEIKQACRQLRTLSQKVVSG